MKTIKRLTSIVLTAAILGITALTTSGDANALSWIGGAPLQKTGAQTSAGRHRPPPWPPLPSTSTVTGTNKWTCKQNGEGCLRPK